MQQTSVELLPGSKAKLVFRVTPEEAQPFLDETVRAMSDAKPIPGFRPGNAPYAEVAKAFGEMRVWEAALERIVRSHYLRAVLDQDLDTVGSPEVQVDKLTPGADIEFTVIAPVAPKVTKLAETSQPLVDFAARTVTEEDVGRALTDLRKMQTKEVRSGDAATKQDLVVIDLDIKKDLVQLEGGAGRDYRIFMAEDHYIPGFTDKLMGVKEGEERSFTLKFPEGHYQKHLAGQDVDFTAKAKSVFKLELPELDEVFAKSLGQPSMDALKKLLKENITAEEEERARQKSEVELLDKLIDASLFSDIPDLLVNEEVRKMLHELEGSVEERGMKWPDYLASVKKTTDELKLDFVPQAIRRIKAATLVKEVAKREGVKVTDEEVNHEIDHILAGIKPDDTETRDRVTSPEYREYVAILLRNQKTLETLKQKAIRNYVPRRTREHGHDEHGH
ncbi:MAG TPA: trigger factor [Candidatus Methylomirabilis sp.]|nr:trigger factor [Candidatus Methylomirabilis sp.]